MNSVIVIIGIVSTVMMLWAFYRAFKAEAKRDQDAMNKKNNKE